MPKEQYKKYYMCEPIHKSNLENTYYKVRCYYNAKTELYDRTLTDEREPWDNTSAFIHNGYIRKLSNEYAIYLYRFCKHVLSSHTHIKSLITICGNQQTIINTKLDIGLMNMKD